MRKAISILLVFLFTSFSSPSLAAPTFQRYTTDYFETVSMLVLYDTPNAPQVWEEVKAILAEIEEAVSVSLEGSDITRFNRAEAGEEVPISPITAEIVQIAQEAYRLTGGLYDPTVFPLVDLWGFSPRFNQNTYQKLMPYDRDYTGGSLPLPSEADIRALLPLVGLDKIELIDSERGYALVKRTTAVTMDGAVIQAQIDLGGIAKGYACDRVMELLRRKGYREGYFVCGGSSMAFLSRPNGEDFTVSAGKPRPGDSDGTDYARMRIRETTLSSSDDQSHYYQWENTVYCHIIDPRTGWPLNTPADGFPQNGTAAVARP